METKFNIITRFSRKESIQNLLSSLYSQTFTNYHHYITYMDNDDLIYLKGITNQNITTFVRVPKYKQFPNLWSYYQYHDLYTDYTNSNWTEEWKMNITNEGKPNKDELQPLYQINYEEVVKYEKNGFWCSTLNRSEGILCQHFPFNLYLKYTELMINDGWILYFDDDDVFESNESLNILSTNINNTDEDTLQIFRFRTRGNDGTELLPHDNYLQFMKTGHPIVHSEVIAGCFCFHSKYRNYTVWDEWRKADIRTVKALERVIPKINYMDEIILSASFREKIYA